MSGRDVCLSFFSSLFFLVFVCVCVREFLKWNLSRDFIAETMGLSGNVNPKHKSLMMLMLVLFPIHITIRIVLFKFYIHN